MHAVLENDYHQTTLRDVRQILPSKFTDMTIMQIRSAAWNILFYKNDLFETLEEDGFLGIARQKGRK